MRRSGGLALLGAALAVAGLATPPAHAELLGTVAGRGGTVRLMTDACRLSADRHAAGAKRATRPAAGAKRATRPAGGATSEGCWTVNGRGNPVVRWSDGRRETLDGDRVRLQRKYALLLEDLPQHPTPAPATPATPVPSRPDAALEPAGPAPRATAPDVPGVRASPAASSPVEPPRTARASAAPAPPAAAVAGSHPRARWCGNTPLLPHERLVCTDPELAAADLALAPLWRAFRRHERLSPAAEAWHKSDYFGRLKACGRQRDCIAREQAEQRRRYEEALARSRPG